MSTQHLATMVDVTVVFYRHFSSLEVSGGYTSDSCALRRFPSPSSVLCAGCTRTYAYAASSVLASTAANAEKSDSLTVVKHQDVGSSCWTHSSDARGFWLHVVRRALPTGLSPEASN